MDSNHRNPKMTDLQSVPFNHSGTYPCLALQEHDVLYTLKRALSTIIFSASRQGCREDRGPWAVPAAAGARGPASEAAAGPGAPAAAGSATGMLAAAGPAAGHSSQAAAYAGRQSSRARQSPSR